MFEQDMKNWSDDEREAVFEIFNDYKTYGYSPVHKLIEEKFYKKPPVSMETFLEDPYYLGAYGESIYPSIKADLNEMFSNRYNEAIYGGAIGVGKSTLGKVALLRMLYEASCLENPYETYGVAHGDKIAFLAISITKYRAQQVILQDVFRIIRDSKYFMEMDPHIKQEECLFPNGLWIAPGASTEQMTIGLNCYGCVMDEINFFAAPGKRASAAQHEMKDKAESIYNSIKRRMESRFMKAGGRLPGMIVILSSKRALNSFTERRIVEAKEDANVFVRERALWEVKGDYSRSQTFRVAVGTDTKMSRLLSLNEPNPEDMRVIDVPVEFSKAFEVDIDGAIRDIAGFATPSITPFITRRDRIVACVNPNRVHPVEDFIWTQDKPTKFVWPLLVERKSGEWRPKLNPMAPRHIHIDLSRSNDSTGITMCHVGGYKHVQRLGDEVDALPVFVVDFTLQIRPATHGEIVQSEIRKLIYDLSAHGYFIKLITTDQYQSVGMREALHGKGYNTEEVSVDRTNGPYETLKQAIYEGRVDYYRYEPLLKELRELEKNNVTGKVDHPSTGSKDISDSLAGAVSTLAKVAPGYYDANQQATGELDNEFEEVQEDAWVLDNGTVPIPDKQPSGGAEWRDEAERKVQEQSLRDQQDKTKYIDWKKNFELPFDMG